MNQRIGGQHDAAEERGAEQRTAHLFEHDAEFDVAVAASPVCLGNVQALQAELLAHLAPHRGVVTVLGFHLLTHGGFGRLALKEATDGLAEFFLFFGEGKVHDGILSGLWPSRPIAVCTHVYTRQMERIGIRELRANVTSVVRRAEAGQTTVVTVAGRAIAQIGPLMSVGPERTFDELIAQGLLVAPRRAAVDGDTSTIAVWGNVRLDRLLREVRG